MEAVKAQVIAPNLRLLSAGKPGREPYDGDPDQRPGLPGRERRCRSKKAGRHRGELLFYQGSPIFLFTLRAAGGNRMGIHVAGVFPYLRTRSAPTAWTPPLSLELLHRRGKMLQPGSVMIFESRVLPGNRERTAPVVGAEPVDSVGKPRQMIRKDSALSAMTNFVPRTSSLRKRGDFLLFRTGWGHGSVLPVGTKGMAELGGLPHHYGNPIISRSEFGKSGDETERLRYRLPPGLIASASGQRANRASLESEKAFGARVFSHLPNTGTGDALVVNDTKVIPPG